jgi:hypothetical protein
MSRLGTRTVVRAGVFAFVLVALGTFPVGCGKGSSGEEQQQSNLKPLAILYGQYTGQHQGRPPAGEAEFKQYVRSQSAMLESFDVTDPESLFVSSRDGKPYVIKYGAVEGPSGPGGYPVVAYEQEGVGGKRFVASSVGAVEEVDEARFKELVPDAP